MADAAPTAVEANTPQHAGVAGQPLYNIRAFYTCTSCALVYSRQVPNCSVCTAPVAPIQGSSHEGNSVCTICRTPLTRRGGKVCGDTCRKRAEKLYRDDPVRYAHLAPRPHRNATRLRTTHSFRKYLRELSTQYDVPLVLPSGAVKPTLYELMPFIAGLDVAYGLTGPRAFLDTGLPISEYMNWREEQNLIVPAYLTNILTEFDE